KAGAQTFALRYVRTPLTIAVDADTVLAVDAIERLLPAFAQSRVAAACGFVLPQRVRSLWERGRYIEYLFAFTFYKQVQEYYGKPLISSGCFSMYRTAILRAQGCCAVSDRPPGPRPPAGEPLGPVGLCDRRPGRPGSCARGCRPAARGRAGPGERSGVLPAPHRQRGLLPACCMRRAAAGSPPAA